jgi:hypothetical protein
MVWRENILRAAEKSGSCFDGLSTNGKFTLKFPSPFALSLVEG